jgi:hypothetical protein
MKQKISHWLPIAVVLQFGVFASSAQTNVFQFTGSQTNINLSPGAYYITVYGAQGGIGQFGSAGGLGAQMEAGFSFSAPTTLTLLVGGGGGTGPNFGDSYYNSGGGGGGSFVVNGTTPLVIAGAGGGGGGVGASEPGGNGSINENGQVGGGDFGGAGGSTGSGGSTGTFFGNAGGGGGFSGSGGDGYYGGGGSSYLSGGTGGEAIYNGYLTGGFGGFGGGGGGGYGYCAGGGGGGYSGGGGGDSDQFNANGGGGGGGSYVDSSAFAILTEVSGVASPDGSTNGEIIITGPFADTVPPTILSVSVTPSLLRPVNHKMVPVNVVVDAVDNFDPSPTAEITQITCNEPPGPSAPDWTITGPLSVNLRAERLGNHDRIYTIYVDVTDLSGNKTTTTATVTVPQSASGSQ